MIDFRRHALLGAALLLNGGCRGPVRAGTRRERLHLRADYAVSGRLHLGMGEAF